MKGWKNSVKLFSLKKIFASNKTFFFVRLIVGSVFIYASLDKLAFPGQFAGIVSKYDILPPKIAVLFAFMLPWLELILGVLMIIGLLLRPTAGLLSLILMVFIAAVVYKYANGTLENCGCFSISPEGGKQSPSLLVGRNILLIISCLYVFFKKEKFSETDLSRPL
jgi:uncharacterized membrane protein YphA (DoxX/SURF4 family)